MPFKKEWEEFHSNPLWKEVKPGVVKPRTITPEMKKMYLQRLINLLKQMIKKGVSSKEIEEMYHRILAKFVEFGEPKEFNKKIGELGIIVEQYLKNA